MKTFLFCVFASGLLSFGALASFALESPNIKLADGGLLFDTVGITSDAKACAGDSADPFEPHLRFISARGGRCIGDDKTHSRSIRILDEKQKLAYGIDAKSLAIANVVHDGKFFVAKVNPDAVQSVYFLTEFFPIQLGSQEINGLAGHVMIRFEFKQGSSAQLIEQDRVKNPVHAEVRNLILSIEALGPTDDPSYSIFVGAAESYAVDYRIISGSERFSEINKTTDAQGPHKIRQRLLTINAVEGAALLTQAIEWSNKYQEKYFYNTVMRSCSTEAYRLIDTVVPSQASALALDLANLEISTLDPVLSDIALSARKLLSSKSVPDFNDDFSARE